MFLELCHLSCKLDEYTRITTPRSDVLFKKGYLSRPKKDDITSSQITTTSSNGSATVSVISGEETAPYYRMQSISPENCSTFASSPNYSTDGFEPDLPLMYSSGFYDGNGYFYVNRMYTINDYLEYILSKLSNFSNFCVLAFVQNTFDQFSGPTILMPYGSSPPNDSMEAGESPYSAASFTSPPIPIEEDPVACTISEAGSINRNSPKADHFSMETISTDGFFDTEPENSILHSKKMTVSDEQKTKVNRVLKIQTIFS